MPDGTRTGAVLLRLAGPLDADTCGHLRYQLAAAFAAGVTSVVVDMSEVSSIDVAGLGVLTGAAKHLQRREGELVLAHPSPEVLTTVRIYDVERLLAVRPSTPLSMTPSSEMAGADRAPEEPDRRLRSVPDPDAARADPLAQPG